MEWWTATYRERGNHKPYRGRPKSLSDEPALSAAKLFANVDKQLETRLMLHFTSIRHANSKSSRLLLCARRIDMKCSSELQKNVREAVASPSQLSDRTMQAMPTLGKRSMTFVQPLGQQQKEDRMRICKRLLRQNHSYFDRIICIDESEFWTSLDKHRSVRVIEEWEKPQLRSLGRAPGKRGQKICLAY